MFSHSRVHCVLGESWDPENFSAREQIWCPSYRFPHCDVRENDQPHLVGGLNPSEKDESQLGWLFPIIIWKNRKCSKPPASHCIPWVFCTLACLSASFLLRLYSLSVHSDPSKPLLFLPCLALFETSSDIFGDQWERPAKHCMYQNGTLSWRTYRHTHCLAWCFGC